MSPSECSEHFDNIILASASPRRADLLRQIGLEFHICPSRVEEPEITDPSPETAVKELALTKARAVSGTVEHGLIIGADTVVVIEGKTTGKPKNRQHAIQLLTQLSGNRHEVITGVALIHLAKNQKCIDAVPPDESTAIEPQEIVWAEKTVVYFRKLKHSEILEYVDSGETADKAGAYGIQGRAAAFVERIEGCYFNVVGLPLASFVEKLATIGTRLSLNSL